MIVNFISTFMQKCNDLANGDGDDDGPALDKEGAIIKIYADGDKKALVTAMLRIAVSKSGKPKDYQGIDLNNNAIVLKGVMLDKLARNIAFRWKPAGAKKTGKFAFK